MNEFKLYCLYDKETLKIRYIGITKQPLKARLCQHLKTKGKNTYKDSWVKSIRENVGIRTIKNSLTAEEARNLEKRLIQKYKDSHRLVNLQDRGFCGDKRVLRKEYCEQIRETLKFKYQNNILPVIGGKKVFVFSNTGKFLGEYENARICSDALNIPYSKVGEICKKGGYYTTYTFTREAKLPTDRYLKCYDILTGLVSYFFKKEELSEFLNVEGTPYNKHYNKDTFYKKRYNLRTDNNLPPLFSSLVLCNGKVYYSLNELITSEQNLSFTYYAEIRKCLNSNTIFKIDKYKIQNVSHAGYKLDELRGTL